MRAVCLIGPTGSGKSSIALSVAEAFSAEIVNFDSRQVYRDFPITTDQPGRQERARVTHRLYGFLEPWEKVDAGGFSALAEQEMEKVHARGRIPLLVGGTGLYLQAIIYGLDTIPRTPRAIRERILRECDSLGPEALHARLAEVDPKAAAAYSPRDRQRVTRALEVYEHTGRPLTWWQSGDRTRHPRHSALLIGLRPDRQRLRELLEQRIEEMLQQGALQEVRQAWQKCPDPEAPAWTGIGCRELLCHVHGQLDLAEAKKQWLKRTRAYAKRQITWFTRYREIQWFEPARRKDIRERIAQWMQ